MQLQSPRFMSNATLTDRAKALERDLNSKLGCYVKVGWMRDNGSEVYMVYIDQRAHIDYKHIPNDWYGNQVNVQLVLPPGVKPPPNPFEDIAW